METSNKFTSVDLIKTEKVGYKKCTLLGIFSWYRKACAEKLQDDIYINTNVTIENIYLNGELLNYK